MKSTFTIINKDGCADQTQPMLISASQDERLGTRMKNPNQGVEVRSPSGTQSPGGLATPYVTSAPAGGQRSICNTVSIILRSFCWGKGPSVTGSDGHRAALVHCVISVRSWRVEPLQTV